MQAEEGVSEREVGFLYSLLSYKPLLNLGKLVSSIDPAIWGVMNPETCHKYPMIVGHFRHLGQKFFYVRLILQMLFISEIEIFNFQVEF